MGGRGQRQPGRKKTMDVSRYDGARARVSLGLCRFRAVGRSIRRVRLPNNCPVLFVCVSAPSGHLSINPRAQADMQEAYTQPNKADKTFFWTR